MRSLAFCPGLILRLCPSLRYADINRQVRCVAGVCKALIEYRIDEGKCTGCTLCAKNCPVECISGEPKKIYTIDGTKCIKCGICHEVCKFDAVEVI